MNETSLPSLPKGIRALRGDQGELVFDLPAGEDKFMIFFFLLFGLPFTGIGFFLCLQKQQWMGLLPIAVGLSIEYAALYFLLARIELRMGADELQWTRVFLRRWKTHVMPREDIAKVGSRVAIRTNGRPTAWSVTLMRKDGLDREILQALKAEREPGGDSADSVAGTAAENKTQRYQTLKQKMRMHKFTRALPGHYKEQKVVWLRDLIARWAGSDCETELDRTYDSSD